MRSWLYMFAALAVRVLSVRDHSEGDGGRRRRSSDDPEARSADSEGRAEGSAPIDASVDTGGRVAGIHSRLFGNLIISSGIKSRSGNCQARGRQGRMATEAMSSKLVVETQEL